MEAQSSLSGPSAIFPALPLFNSFVKRRGTHAIKMGYTWNPLWPMISKYFQDAPMYFIRSQEIEGQKWDTQIYQHKAGVSVFFYFFRLLIHGNVTFVQPGTICHGWSWSALQITLRPSSVPAAFCGGSGAHCTCSRFRTPPVCILHPCPTSSAPDAIH